MLVLGSGSCVDSQAAKLSAAIVSANAKVKAFKADYLTDFE
jgi:hypothetical protein